MFDAVISFFESIGEVIQLIGDFIIDFITGLVSVVTLTAEFVVNIPSYFAWMPASVLGIIIATFSVVVVYKIIGREG